jgi:hypothetical protein
MVTAITAAMDRNVRTVWNSSQRDWIERQSTGRVAAVHTLILLSIGTSIANVTTNAPTISRNPASSHQKAGERRSRHSSASVTRALTSAIGSSTAIGPPRFWIIS